MLGMISLGAITRKSAPCCATGRLTCVAGRVWAPATDEAAEETEQDLAIALDPLQQLCLAAFHSGSPVAFTRQAVEQFMGRLWGGQAS
jgi:hypothetical protein